MSPLSLHKGNCEYKIILGIMFALVMLGGMSVQPTPNPDGLAYGMSGHAGFPSLKEALEDRKRGDPLVCPNPEHVLVLRQNSGWACVYSETAKHLGWDVVLYSEQDAPQITTSVSFRDGRHNVTYQASEGTIGHIENIGHPVESIESGGYVDAGSNGFFLLMPIMPTQGEEGHLTVMLPSLESDMFAGYCAEIGAIPSTEYFEYRANYDETVSVEIEERHNSTKIKLHYGHDVEFLEISLWCLV